ncbi:MAG: dTDP-4-dehydrorhamnose 3,5-epimerase [Treponema sp.]|jgi:dTDP-4-dehydrorhamnose 3,5-epimerase|nr:dTDP-4-dehydrorhamnose 3,5-epimerase [Treponema sp.]
MTRKFSFEKTRFDGVFLIKPFVAEDERGYFLKDYSKELFASNGVPHELQEVFYTSSYKGVIRAIHFQREKEQPKLVRCVKGSVFDVVVDLRPGSQTLGQWEGFHLNDENKNEVLIPAHFGHGYLVLEDSIVSYKCAEKFYGEFDDGILWNDSDINVQWPLENVGDIILSEKDKNLQSFAEWKTKRSERTNGI